MAASALLLLSARTCGHPPLVLVYGAAALNAAFVSISMPTALGDDPSPRPARAAAAGRGAEPGHVERRGRDRAGPGRHRRQRGSASRGPTASTSCQLRRGACAPRSRSARSGRSPPTSTRTTSGSRPCCNGLRYLRGKRVLQSTFTVDIVAMVFGMPRVLFPVLSDKQFHRGTRGGRLAVRARPRSGPSSAR